MLLKIDFISGRQPITAKFAEIWENATAFILVQDFCKLRQSQFVYFMSRQNLFTSIENNQKLPQVKDCRTSRKCDSFDLFSELRKKQTALICLLNV